MTIAFEKKGSQKKLDNGEDMGTGLFALVFMHSSLVFISAHIMVSGSLLYHYHKSNVSWPF